MARGTHAPARKHRAIVIVAIVAVALVLAAGGAAYSAYRYEQDRAHRILPGVMVAGVEVGGMTKEEAVTAVREAAEVELQRRVTLRVGDRTWRVSLRELGQRSNALGAVNQALGLNGTMGTFTRFWHRFNDEPVGQEIDLRISGHKRVDAVLGRVAREVAVKPVDADITYADGGLRFVKPKPGRALDFAQARSAVRAALRAGETDVQLPMLKVRPKVTAENMPRTIVVRVDQNKLYLYDGFKVIRTWSVATAMPGYTTPPGDWKLTRMAVNPTWYNPALDSWGASLPAVVPGGPTAPMGTRALYIDEAPGLIRIHGTPADSSIGTYASHGCIRMHNWEVEELYDMVEVGMRVIIVGSRPGSAVEGDTPDSVNI